jgi:hypothetical protein
LAAATLASSTTAADVETSRVMRLGDPMDARMVSS